MAKKFNPSSLAVILIAVGIVLMVPYAQTLLRLLTTAIYPDYPVIQFFVYQGDPSVTSGYELPNGTLLAGHGVISYIEVWTDPPIDTDPLTWDGERHSTTQRYWTYTDKYGLNWFGFPFDVQCNRTWSWKVTYGAEEFTGPGVYVPFIKGTTIVVGVDVNTGAVHIYPEDALEEPVEQPETPRPQYVDGYFTINGERVDENSEIRVSDPNLQFDFYVTKGEAFLRKGDVFLRIYKEGWPNEIKVNLENQSSTHYSVIYTLPEPGVYIIRGCFEHLGTVHQVLSVYTVLEGEKTDWNLLMFISGVAMTTCGFVLHIKSRRKR